ncbi:hypothetical protein D623_10035306 [Myotis brandtii]|uniref:Uncharacterized protein n=1 Tax=Myotis brandtii TaxID=109478 RepID=S7MPW7_MYOBR|nr:hypothetical protein D623_10035306 [Myotis brandtii]
MAISQVTKVVADAETWWTWAGVTTALSLLEGMFMKTGSSHFCSRGAPGYGVYSRQKKARTTYVPLPVALAAVGLHAQVIAAVHVGSRTGPSLGLCMATQPQPERSSNRHEAHQVGTETAGLSAGTD